MSEASPAPARACEPAEAADSADPRAALKAHLYAMANNAFELQLHREFPKYKTMLKGWDGQQFIWQKRNKAVMAQHFGVTVEDLRAEWDAAKRRFQKNRAAELSRDRTNKHNKDQASRLRLGGPVLPRKAKSELFSALFKLHHLANCMYHRLEENEAKRSSLLPFEGSQI